MRYVILRDDDTNALTPVDCLERLYRPFLERRLPVNLAVIPDVSMDATTPGGKPEGFLLAGRARFAERAVLVPAEGERSADLPIGLSGIQRAQADREIGAPVHGKGARTVPIGHNESLVRYLHENPGFRVVQHGCHHDFFEFDRAAPEEVSARLDRGLRLLKEAGFSPTAFVAPHDKFSRASYRAVAKRFRVISGGWFELRRLPFEWWPKYLLRKARGTPHWRVRQTALLSHPGCLLSCHRSSDAMLDAIIRTIESQRLTVLVTHWWEYFRDGRADEPFIHFLHQTAGYLAARPDIRVVSFADLANGRMRLN